MTGRIWKAGAALPGVLAMTWATVTFDGLQLSGVFGHGGYSGKWVRP